MAAISRAPGGIGCEDAGESALDQDGEDGVEDTSAPVGSPPHPSRLSARVAGLGAAAHPGPAVAVTVGAALLGRAAGLGPGVEVLLVAAVLTGQLSIGWSNDLVDLSRDRHTARADKPIATGRVEAALVRAACVVAVVACVPLSLALGWSAGVVHLVCVGAGWAYNLGLKATPWSWLPYAVAFGGLPSVAGLARGSEGLPWWVNAAGALLGVGAHLVNAVPDLADDAATGVRGLPHRLGARWSVVSAVLLLGAASVTVALGSSGLADPVTLAALALVGLLVVVALVGEGRTAFRAAMVIALVDVALLAWAL